MSTLNVMKHPFQPVSAVFILALAFGAIGSCQSGTPPEPPNYYDWTTRPQQVISWPTLADTPWPVFRADAQATGRSRWPGPQNGYVAWKRFVGGRVGVPLIGPDSALYGTNSYGYDEQGGPFLFMYRVLPNGTLQSKISLNFPPNSPIGSSHTECQPLLGADGAFYIGSNNGNFYAVELDGRLRWQYRAESAVCSQQLNIDLEGNLYFFDRDKRLYCLSPDGNIRWRILAPDGMEFVPRGVAFSPDGETLYAYVRKQVEGEWRLWLLAMNRNGERSWQVELGRFHSAVIPVVDNAGRIYSAATEFYVHAPSGKLLWKRTFPGAKVGIEPTIDHNGQIYVNAGNWLYSYDYEGQRRWRIYLGSSPASQPLICDANNVIYYMGDALYAVSDRGIVLWSVKLDAAPFGTATIGYHRMLFTGTMFTTEGQQLIAVK